MFAVVTHVAMKTSRPTLVFVVFVIYHVTQVRDSTGLYYSFTFSLFNSRSLRCLY